MQLPVNAPPWMQLAWREIGTREQPGNKGPAIARYIELSHCGEQGDPWCAIFANAMLEESGVHGTRSPSSQSFRHDANFEALPGPALGAIVVFWRTSKASGLGHVGFYVGERDGYVYTLGGNEGDMVQVEFLAKAASTFGLVGYFWPKTVPLPALGAIAIGAAIPAHQVSVTDEPAAAKPSAAVAHNPTLPSPQGGGVASSVPLHASSDDYAAAELDAACAAARAAVNAKAGFYASWISDDAVREVVADALSAAAKYRAGQVSPPAPAPVGEKNQDSSEGDQDADRY